MKTKVIAVITTAFLSVGLWAQTGNIKGTVTTSDGKPAEFVNVGVKGMNKGATTNTSGEYTISAVPIGEQTLITSYVGTKSVEKTITVKDGEIVIVDIEIEQQNRELQTVEILGRKENDYKSDYSFAATKMEMKSVDIPQSISTVTKEVIKDQQAYRLNDVAKLAAGVNQFSTYDDITMRGFRNSEYRLINGMRMTPNFWSSPLLVNIERVEFLKGPSSALFGNSNPGGTINMVTKKPLREQQAAIDFATGSFGTLRTTGDFTGSLNEKGNLLYRLNLGYENAGSHRDRVNFNTLALAPTITFLPDDKTRINFELSYTDNNSVLDRGRPTFKDDENLLSTPINFNLTQPGDLMSNKTLYGILSINREITKNISINASYMKFTNDGRLKEHGFNGYVTNDSIGLYYTDRIYQESTDNLTVYLTSKFKTGKIEHQLMGGFDYILSKTFSTEWWADESTVGGFSLTNPVFNHRDVSKYTPIYDDWSYWEGNYSNMGAYAQHLMKWNKLQVLLGLRYDRYEVPLSSWEFKGSDITRPDVQTAILPRVGLVYGLLPTTNVYATFNQGYMPVDPWTNSTPSTGGPFLPMYSQLIEGGFKGEYFKKRLLATVSAYQIQMNNVLVSANDQNNPNLLEQRGQETATGFEIEAVGKINKNLQVLANYSFNNAVISKSDDETVIGLVKENAPNHISGTWIKYTFTEGATKGLGLAVGHSQVSRRRTFDQYSNGDWLYLPSYAVFNAAVYYQVDKFRVAVNLNNITNETYFTGGYNFQRNWTGAPRNFLVSVGYTF
jgi:iron complex outermembrane recepter protein